MENSPDLLPDDVAALRAELIAARAKGAQIEAELAVAKAKASDDLAVIARQKLRIEKLERQLYGPKAERRARLIDQMEFQLAELEMAATEDELAAELAVAATVNVAGFTRSRPAKKAFPEHLPRERVVVPGPMSCQCCGGDRLRKLGEDITETLEVVPRQWKVIQTVREKFTCRDCDVRDDRPFGGTAAPSAMFYYSRDRAGEHPQAHLAGYSGILQADAYTGYTKLYLPDRRPGPITEAACWVHARRPFFAMADVEANARRRAQGKKPAVISPIALDMVQRIDALFDIEIRKAVRQERSKPLVLDLEAWMKGQRAKLSRNDDLAKAFDYLLNRWSSFTLFLDDGRVCLSNNAAERALRGIAPASLVRLKVTLDHVEPTVMRRVVVPFRIKLHRLHEVLQAAMGWTNSHLYEFRIRDVGFGLSDQHWGDGPLDARKTSLLAAIEDIGAKSFKYLYDFGDGWTHSIKIERTFPVIGLAEPMLLEAIGRCPPEDIGGPWGYQEFREALADPAHERHAEFVEWWGGKDYDPDQANFAELNKAVDDLAAKWARKSRRKI